MAGPGDVGEGTVVRRKTEAVARPTTARPSGSRARTAPAATPAAEPAPPGAPVAAGALPVRPGEDPWTEQEVAELRQELETEAAGLSAEIAASEEAVSGLMRDSGDGAGDDQVDAGTKNISREHEMSLAANARDMLAQTERALARLNGTGFGLCESCGEPIGKARVQAFPRATLCVQCKSKQERR
ncbi:TraR/DksA family transcriptional regulator [Streptacidiphilus carbonis]|uniref:TraR/DksA family transcriptional regulator n=1 Tax=Streptacidiphilus carbonis TaxID=105422 RepID=UPI0034E21CBA